MAYGISCSRTVPMLRSTALTAIRINNVVGSRTSSVFALTSASIRSLHTSTPHGERTEVQIFGGEYLKKQRELGRPLSPTLSIYKPQLTWVLSGLHRVSGCVMAGTLLIGGAGFVLLPMDFTSFVQMIDGWHVPWPLLDAFKFVIAYHIFFHSLNGLRFLAFDMAMGIDLRNVYKSGWGVIGLSALLSVLVVVLARRAKTKRNKKA